MNPFSQSLKRWRQSRRLSQLELAGMANVSARHISFLETGRARPSREMVGRLADSLHLPLVEHNQMLVHAGFATRYVARQWSDPDMALIRASLDHTLVQHDPYPAMALDRLWSIKQMNIAATGLFEPVGITVGSSLLDWVMSETPAEHIDNWPAVAHHLFKRLRTESIALGGAPELDEVADHLFSQAIALPEPAGPVVPTVFNAGQFKLSLFTTIAHFGTPEDLFLDDLKIELFFPANDESRDWLLSLVRGI